MGLQSVDDAVDTTLRGDEYVPDDEEPVSRLAPVDPDAAFNAMMATAQPPASSTPAPKPAQGADVSHKSTLESRFTV